MPETEIEASKTEEVKMEEAVLEDVGTRGEVKWMRANDDRAH